MTNNTYLTAPATCSECGLSTTDINLLARHSCAVTQHGGRCEDFPACGHETGDCNGLLYGSDEAIQSDPHLLCDHNTGNCEVWDREQDEMAEKLEDLADRVAAARNYSMEANMADYSMSSIERAARDLAEVKAEADALGTTLDELAPFDSDRGCFLAL